jgi:hypothetical protein
MHGGCNDADKAEAGDLSQGLHRGPFDSAPGIIDGKAGIGEDLRQAGGRARQMIEMIHEMFRVKADPGE